MQDNKSYDFANIMNKNIDEYFKNNKEFNIMIDIKKKQF